jgi:hypothetical protein
MYKEITKTIIVIALIGFTSYLLFGSIATLTIFVLPIYGLSLVRSKNEVGIKTVLVAMLLLIIMYLINIFLQ